MVLIDFISSLSRVQTVTGPMVVYSSTKQLYAYLSAVSETPRTFSQRAWTL